jgi:tetratricopeptide (TPR) repeat protein
MESLDRIYTELIGKHLANEPRLTRVREQFLREALSFYQRIARENDADEMAWDQTGRAYLTQGRIHNELDQLEAAEEALLNSLRVFLSLALQNPGDVVRQRHAAAALADHGNFMVQIGLAEIGIDSLSGAFRLLEPDGDPATEESLSAQLESTEHATLLASIHDSLGCAFSLADDKARAQEAHRRAMRLRSALVERDPDNADRQRDAAASLARLGLLQLEAGVIDDALKLIQEAIERQQRSLELNPGNVVSRRLLRNHFHVLGGIRRGQGDAGRALEAHRQGNDYAVALASDFPHVVADQLGEAYSNFSLAHALLDVGQVEAADARYRTCLAYWAALPDIVSWATQLGIFYDAATYHSGSIVVPSENGIAKLREAVRQSRSPKALESLADFLRDQNLEKLPDVGSTEQCPIFEAVIQSLLDDQVDVAKGLLGGVDDVHRSAFEGLIAELTGDANLEPVFHVHVVFIELLFGHARALAELGERLQDARSTASAPHAATEVAASP